MATNKNQERLSTLQLLAPANTNIASNAPIILSQPPGTHYACGVAVEAVNTTNPIYDENDSYFVADFEGVYNLTVKAQTSGSPSAGAAIKPGTAIYADGGTFDLTSGVTTGITLSVDTGGTFFGMALDTLAAGTTGTIRVILKNSV
jgi:hypothetical protein